MEVPYALYMSPWCNQAGVVGALLCPYRIPSLTVCKLLVTCQCYYHPTLQVSQVLLVVLSYLHLSHQLVAFPWQGVNSIPLSQLPDACAVFLGYLTFSSLCIAPSTGSPEMGTGLLVATHISFSLSELAVWETRICRKTRVPSMCSSRVWNGLLSLALSPILPLI